MAVSRPGDLVVLASKYVKQLKMVCLVGMVNTKKSAAVMHLQL